MNRDELNSILEEHSAWLRGEGGRRADLRGADLSGADLSGAVLSDAVLRGADLSGAVLSDAVLSDADLRGADLRGADLSDADLRGADLSGAVLSYDASWIPKIDSIHRTVFEAASKPEALNMSTWHTCDSTHCRAGWVVHLAGEGGRVMEGLMGTAAAAALIYIASDPSLERIPSWYATNEEALQDMKRLAEQEASA